MLKQCADNRMECTFIRGMKALGDMSKLWPGMLQHAAGRALCKLAHVPASATAQPFQRCMLRGRASRHAVSAPLHIEHRLQSPSRMRAPVNWCAE
jgi:hypothetical protein